MGAFVGGGGGEWSRGGGVLAVERSTWSGSLLAYVLFSVSAGQVGMHGVCGNLVDGGESMIECVLHCSVCQVCWP